MLFVFVLSYVQKQFEFVKIFICLSFFYTNYVNASLLIGKKYSKKIFYFIKLFLKEFYFIGAVFPHYGYSTNISMESDQEIIFKHAIYVSNQNKLAGFNSASSHPTLLHKIIHVNKQDQLKTIKNSNDYASKRLNFIFKLKKLIIVKFLVCKETSGNLVALVGPHENVLKSYVKSLCQDLELIHFDIEPTLDPSYSFNFYPALDVLCQAFSDLIKTFEWKHTAIIYNSNTSLLKFI